MQDATQILTNWGRYFGLRAGVPESSWGGLSQYMTPEEKAQAGTSCGVRTLSEADAMRADAVIATLRQSALYQSFAILLEKHFMFRADPRKFCRGLGFAYRDYDVHIATAVAVFWQQWQMFALVPTKMIRVSCLNNRLTLQKTKTTLAVTT